jgi:4-carboxymuconolactone decarboxylase
MNNKVAALIAGIFALVLSGTITSETPSMKTEGSSNKQAAIVTIAAFTASGDLRKLTDALNEGLDAGLTINEIKEILVQMYAYCGFPRSLNGNSTFMSVLEVRENKGVKDEPGKEPSPLPTRKSSVEVGTENQTKLIGAPATGKYIAFTPAIDQFLKAHLFGDIFARDNLDWQSREIATVAALANLDGVNSQLESHINIALNTGVTGGQLRDLIRVIEAKVGTKQGHNVSEVCSKTLAGE